jgi:hypothetical protein
MIRKFYLTYKDLEKSQSVIGKFKMTPASNTGNPIWRTVSAKSQLVADTLIRQSLIATSGVKDKKSQSPIGQLSTLYALADSTEQRLWEKAILLLLKAMPLIKRLKGE